MTISEYIERLEWLKEEHGDLQMASWWKEERSFIPVFQPCYLSEPSWCKVNASLGKEFIGV